MIEEATYTKPLTCAVCKGMCCVRFAGIYHPDDFTSRGQVITEDFIFGLLKTGKFSVNMWDGDFVGADAKTYDSPAFLHPRHLGQKPYDHNYGGTCSNWTLQSGCSLAFKDRPYQCRALVAKVNGGECKPLPKDKASKEDLIFAWLPYSHILREAGERLEREGFNFHNEGDRYDVYENTGRYQILMGRKPGDMKEVVEMISNELR